MGQRTGSAGYDAGNAEEITCSLIAQKIARHALELQALTCGRRLGAPAIILCWRMQEMLDDLLSHLERSIDAVQVSSA